MTLSGKSSLILRENKAVFCRESDFFFISVTHDFHEYTVT